MQIVEFKAVIAERRDDAVIIALFDGASVPACIAILKCEFEAAEAMMKAIGSALGSRGTR